MTPVGNMSSHVAASPMPVLPQLPRGAAQLFWYCLPCGKPSQFTVSYHLKIGAKHECTYLLFINWLQLQPTYWYKQLTGKASNSIMSTYLPGEVVRLKWSIDWSARVFLSFLICSAIFPRTYGFTLDGTVQIYTLFWDSLSSLEEQDKEKEKAMRNNNLIFL